MMRVIEAAYMYSWTINSIIHYIYCNFCATPTHCTWNLQNRSLKSNLSRLVKPSDLSQVSKPKFDQGPHNLAWSVLVACHVLLVNFSFSAPFLPRDATQSAVLPRQVVCPSVCLSVCDVDVGLSLGRPQHHGSILQREHPNFSRNRSR